jgi:isochorismate pyruvate lyase
MKTPESCTSIEDVREAIDGLDQTVIETLARRARYVRAAATFKKTATDVHAPDRVASMLVKRRGWAEANGVDPAFVESLFRSIVGHFLGEELEAWKSGAVTGSGDK